MYYDTVRKLNIRVRVGEVPSTIITDQDADEFCRMKEGEIESTKVRIQRRLAWKSRYYDFEKLLETHIEVRKRESPNNWKNDIYYLEQYVFNFFLNGNNYSNINDWYIHFEPFKEWLETIDAAKGSQKLSYSTKNQCIKALNAFLKVMKRKNKIERLDQCPQFPRHLEKQKDAESVISAPEKELIYASLHDQSKLAAYFFKVLCNTGLRINEGLGLSLDDLFKGDVGNKALDAQLKKEGIQYHGYIVLESQPKSTMVLRDIHGIVERKPLKGKRVISSQCAFG
jgi:hypothetical protein